MVVVDHSAILPLFLPDEDPALAERLVVLASKGESLIAPSLWLTGFGNAILVCERRERISAEQREEAHLKAARLPIAVEAFPNVGALGETHRLCEKHKLSFYDGTYLALALFKDAKLATNDRQLKKAAKKEGILFC